MNEKPINFSDEDKRKFMEWAQIAYVLNAIKPRLMVKEGEIWSCYLGMNIGYEERGSGPEYIRPVIIIKIFSKELLLAVPLTSTIKNSKYYYEFQFIPDRKSCALISHWHTIDANRLKICLGNVKHRDLRNIKKRLTGFLLQASS